ncbi:hypothetical protein COLO4_28830 [Corchorus olitorius]|uniref:Uncharacterized protein n=1 Tax=Corchorus olitorius TaxID=93759 RepID=A0A1R3HI29_9ROSI|nr:hypothetical protein COLO4_28830 [Corchorus olitorius]
MLFTVPSTFEPLCLFSDWSLPWPETRNPKLELPFSGGSAVGMTSNSVKFDGLLCGAKKITREDSDCLASSKFFVPCYACLILSAMSTYVFNCLALPLLMTCLAGIELYQYMQL